MRHGRYSRIFAIFALLLCLLVCPALARTGIAYEVDVSQLQNSILTVTATYPPGAFSASERVLALPVWTPGSYKVRDYSRFVGTVEALTPGVTVEKIRKNRWRLSGVPEDMPVIVRYPVYGHESTVRTNYFTPELSLLVGAATFLAPAPLKSDQMVKLPYEVRFRNLHSPAYSSMESSGNGVFTAQDYDELVDSPIVFGEVAAFPFQAGGVPHTLLQAGDRRFWDINQTLADLPRLVETIQNFWGVVPYDRFIFFNLITDGRGGLEHRGSTVFMTRRFATEEHGTYLEFLSLLCHEFFHTWNVKRLRPEALGPFDYEDEVYTRSLWVVEGITSYYDDLLVRRAGLSTRAEYLTALSKQLNALKETPGRKAITLGDASFDAWIRLYQPSDDLQNSNVSYYTKGAVVAWMLDTEIRKHTRGARSLDDLMRKAYREFQGTGYSEEEFRALASQVADTDLSAFFHHTVDSASDLDLTQTLRYWGLKWVPQSESVEPYLGLDLEADTPRAVVTKVFAGSPAAQAGILPGDELIAVDGVRLPATSPLSVLKNLDQKRALPLMLSRLGRVYTREVRLSDPLHRKMKLEFGEANRSNREKWNGWLGPESELNS